MMRSKCVGIVAAVLSCFTWMLPQPAASGAEPNARLATAALNTPKAVRDIALGPGGRLSGQLVDAQGRPLANQEISVRSADRQVVNCQTDSEGRYWVTGLPGGVYQVVGAGDIAVCRCWSQAAAPPSASAGLLLVDGRMVQRGQAHFEDVVFADPVLIGLFIAAAIAIPIAIHESRDDSSSGS